MGRIAKWGQARKSAREYQHDVNLTGGMQLFTPFFVELKRREM